MNTRISTQQVTHVSQLANIPLSEEELAPFATAFEETLNVIENLATVDISGTEPTHQVTGLENVLREDQINEKRMFSQAEALANAKKTHNGFFMVDRIIDND